MTGAASGRLGTVKGDPKYKREPVAAPHKCCDQRGEKQGFLKANPIILLLESFTKPLSAHIRGQRSLCKCHNAAGKTKIKTNAFFFTGYTSIFVLASDEIQK